MASMGLAGRNGPPAIARPRVPAAARYMAVETAVSVAINAVLNTVPPALSLGLQSGAAIPALHHLTAGAVPQVFMGAFMSGLVPSLLARRRFAQGRLPLAQGRDAPKTARVVATSLCLATAATVLGLLLIGAALPQLAAASPPVAARLLLYAAFGGCVAAVVTPSVLLLTFRRAGRTGGVAPA